MTKQEKIEKTITFVKHINWRFLYPSKKEEIVL